MSELGPVFLSQTTEIIRQLIVISTLLLGFSFSLVVQLVTSKDLSEALGRARRTFFWALVKFIAATGSSLILLIRIHGQLALASITEPVQIVTPVHAQGWFNLLFSLLLLTLSLGLVLWVSVLCQLALTDERTIAMLIILTIGLVMPDS